MKLLKISFSAILITTGIITMLAFTSKSSLKNRTAPDICPTYYWQGPTSLISSLTHQLLQTESNWGSTAVDLGNAYKLAAIEFNEELFDEDGGSDGQLTKEEAIAAVSAHYEAAVTHSFDSYDFLVDNTRVLIYKKAN